MFTSVLLFWQNFRRQTKTNWRVRSIPVDRLLKLLCPSVCPHAYNDSRINTEEFCQKLSRCFSFGWNLPTVRARSTKNWRTTCVKFIDDVITRDDDIVDGSVSIQPYSPLTHMSLIQTALMSNVPFAKVRSQILQLFSDECRINHEIKTNKKHVKLSTLALPWSRRLSSVLSVGYFIWKRSNPGESGIIVTMLWEHSLTCYNED
jgi:hypothetical protein